MRHTITASFEQLLEDAHVNIGIFLREAVNCVDRQFGEGYAKENPSLVAALVSASSREFSFTCTMRVLEHTVSSVLEELPISPLD